MLSDRLFDLANIYILPFWFLMIVLPNLNLTKKVMKSYLIYIPLIFLYIYYLVTSFSFESAQALGNFQPADIATLLSSEKTAAAAWIHFLAIDLFTGRWIYWQGQEKNIWTIHSLIICVFLCPVALLSHFVTEWLFYKDNDGDRNSAEAKTTADVN